MGQEKASHLRPLGTHRSLGADVRVETWEVLQCEGVKLYQMGSPVAPWRPAALHYNRNNLHLIFQWLLLVGFKQQGPLRVPRQFAWKQQLGIGFLDGLYFCVR